MIRTQENRFGISKVFSRAATKNRRTRVCGETRSSWKSLLAITAVFAFASFASLTQVQAQSSSRFAERIHRALVTLPYYSVFDNLAFRIENNDKVVLLGQVTRPTLKSGAENVIKRLEEVTSVDNQIEVLPVSSLDDRIRLETYRAIYQGSLFTRYAVRAIPPIHIIVKNGNVTLEGAVASETDKDVAKMLASGVPGVFSVTNDLVVDKEKKDA